MNTQTPQAPQSAPQPQPQQHEVPINPNPVNQPAPVGSQAPQDPNAPIAEGSKHRTESRRESIQRAFRAAEENAANDAAKPKPAARPPEKKTAAPDQQAQQPHRENGRFARNPNLPQQQDQRAQQQPGQQQPGQQQPGQQQQQPRQQHAPLPNNAPYRDPPQRMGEHAKADWHGTPESVRGEVARMNHEFGQAYQRYRGDNETMNTIRPFQQMAAKHGTTLQQALTNYVGMEEKLRSDVIGGLDMIINNLALKTPDGRPVGLRDVAYHILNRSPEQHQMTQAGNMQNAMSLQLGQISQRLDQMNQQQRAMQQENAFRQTRSAIDVFADDGKHPRFDELADLIEIELQHGYDLQTAYSRAEMLRPAGTQAAQTRNSPRAAQTRDPSAQTRPSDRSISGSPDAGDDDAPRRRSNTNGSGKKEKATGRREAIQNAMRRAGGSF